MSVSRHYMRWTTALAVLLLPMMMSLGCRSSPEPAPERDRTSRRIISPATPEPPPPDELAASPCGNPNWAKLPGELGEEVAPAENGEPQVQEEPEEPDESPTTP